MQETSIILNRLRKNLKIRKNLIKSEGIEAYRLYEKDIPEYPYIIDIYKDYAVIYEKGKKIGEDDELNDLVYEHRTDIFAALGELLNIPENKIHLKERVKQSGKQQYEKIAKDKLSFAVKEGEMKFKVNLEDYLDTGLFLDHRPLRKIINQTSASKKVLNLFAYTGSFSVAAALGGGVVTTVDMSRTYLDWARDNFRINDITIKDHHFTQADAVNYIMNLVEKFDIIILDPPSFSNSKRMEDIFDVQRDHITLIEKLMSLLNPEGVLYFSNNLRSFKLDFLIREGFKIEDLTYKSIPKDFRDQKIHQCYKITQK